MKMVGRYTLPFLLAASCGSSSNAHLYYDDFSGSSSEFMEGSCSKKSSISLDEGILEVIAKSGACTSESSKIRPGGNPFVFSARWRVEERENGIYLLGLRDEQSNEAWMYFRDTIDPNAGTPDHLRCSSGNFPTGQQSKIVETADCEADTIRWITTRMEVSERQVDYFVNDQYMATLENILSLNNALRIIMICSGHPEKRCLTDYVAVDSL